MKIRLLAALAVLVSGYVHLHLWTTGVKDQHVVGPAFMVNVVAAVVIAVLLLVWRGWEPPLLATGFGAATIVAFVISATVGLYGVHEHWTGSLVWTAFIAETVAIVAGLTAFWREGRRPQLRHSHGGIRRPTGA